MLRMQLLTPELLFSQHRASSAPKQKKGTNDNCAALEKAAAEKAKGEHIISIAKMLPHLIRGLNSKSSASRAADQGQAQNATYQIQSGAEAKAKKGKTSLKAMINKASKMISLNVNEAATSHEINTNLSHLPKWITHFPIDFMLLLTEATLFFVDLLVTNYESVNRDLESIGGMIIGWLAHVQEKTSLQPIFAKALDMLTSVFKLSSQPSKAGTSSIKPTTQYLQTDADIITKFGGVRGGPGERNGKDVQEHCFGVIPSTPDSDSEIKASQIPPWYNSYKGAPPPSQPQVPSTVLKRFEMEMSVSVVHTNDDAQLMVKKVKMEADNIFLSKKTKALEHKSHSDYKNIDLPVMADQKWMSVFMDTVILWAGGQTNIWSIPDETLATSLQKIFSTIYPDIEHKVTIHSPVFEVVSQCLLKWHSGFGSAALAMVIHYFWEMIENTRPLVLSTSHLSELTNSSKVVTWRVLLGLQQL
ncbi:hypothetical protein HD554DRAFT_2040064 [Boletus coccyginus]|nr:hypothetical protein HD554DRAFT_2040064 [Boletus coccyginus]